MGVYLVTEHFKLNILCQRLSLMSLFLLSGRLENEMGKIDIQRLKTGL